MTLREKQSKFALMVSNLIAHIYAHGYTLTFGDAWAKSGHKVNSKHYSRLAIDLNLFYNGKWLKKTEAHLQFGIYWESIGGTWGGRFSKPDGNHYEY